MYPWVAILLGKYRLHPALLLHDSIQQKQPFSPLKYNYSVSLASTTGPGDSPLIITGSA